MAASILNSDKAIEVSILVVRAFVRMRQMIGMVSDLHREFVCRDEFRAAGPAGCGWGPVRSAPGFLPFFGRKRNATLVHVSAYCPEVLRPELYAQITKFRDDVEELHAGTEVWSYLVSEQGVLQEAAAGAPEIWLRTIENE